MTGWLGEDMVVVSPHLDDAVLSMGGAIADACSQGAKAKVVTVFAGDLSSDAEPAPWDQSCGFQSARAAAAGRREEDSAALAILGARPEWLPFYDAQYEFQYEDDDIWALLEPTLGSAGHVLIPGYPLVHSDHRRVRDLLIDRLEPGRLALYAEQPYLAAGLRADADRSMGIKRAARDAVLARVSRRRDSLFGHDEGFPGLAAEWKTHRCTRRGSSLKRSATRAYESQMRGLGRTVWARVWLYESLAGGERFGILTPDRPAGVKM